VPVEELRGELQVQGLQERGGVGRVCEGVEGDV